METKAKGVCAFTSLATIVPRSNEASADKSIPNTVRMNMAVACKRRSGRRHLMISNDLIASTAAGKEKINQERLIGLTVMADSRVLGSQGVGTADSGLLEVKKRAHFSSCSMMCDSTGLNNDCLA